MLYKTFAGVSARVSTADHRSGKNAVLHDLEETCKTKRNHLSEQRVVV